MRISTNYQFNSYTQGIDGAAQRVFEAQMRVQSGKRITKPSDDPVGTTSSLAMRAAQTSIQQYSKNLTTAKGTLGYSETSLSDANDLLTQGYQIAVQGANSSNSQEARSALAQEVTSLQNRLVDMANAQGPKGDYLFAGQKTDAKPFTVTGNTLTYNGDGNNVVVETGANSSMVTNTQGSPTFSDAYDRLESLKQNLLNGSIGSISANDIGNLQKSRDLMTQERGVIGTKMQALQDLDTQNTRRIDDLTSGISDIEDVDMSQAITDYNLANTAYQAALTVASQGTKLSLMNFISG